MKISISTVISLFILLSLGSCDVKEDEMTYSVVSGRKNGMEMVYRFISEMPKPSVVQRYKWLTVISWKYDRAVNNGMPDKSTFEEMNRFEDAIYEMLRSTECGIDVYITTGNGEREFVYYIEDREKFTSHLNSALSSHKVYPIEIEFFEDVDWVDFKKMMSIVSKAANKSSHSPK